MNIPNFKNDDEEAQWWYDHREDLGEQAAAAIHEGRTLRPSPETLKNPQARAAAIKANTMSVQLPESDFMLARKLAEKKGVPYETYVQNLLHEALERESSATK